MAKLNSKKMCSFYKEKFLRIDSKYRVWNEKLKKYFEMTKVMWCFGDLKKDFVQLDSKR